MAAMDRRSTGEARVDGKRYTDPSLTTRACADRLGVTPQFITGEIRAGRLRAQALSRDRLRLTYRVSPAELDAYIRRYSWTPAEAS